MKTYEITPLHINAGAYNGKMFFLLDGRLLSITFGTPMFNDYSLWRLKEMVLSTEPYVMEDDLIPFDFKPITITQDELDMLDIIFKPLTNDKKENIEKWVQEVLDWESKNPDYHHALRYIEGYEEILSTFEYKDNKLVHILFDAAKEKHEDISQDWEAEEGEHLEHEKWTPKGNLAHYHGLYDLLIPVVESLMHHYQKEDAVQTNDVFI